MKYCFFFDDGEYYYCYSKNGKYYKGKNSMKFVPDYKYFLSIIITTYVGNILNEIYYNIHNKLLCVGMIFMSIILSMIFGTQSYKKIIKKSETELKEVFLSEKEIKMYLVEGMKRFRIQVLMLYTFVILDIFFFMSFYYCQNVFLLLFGAVLTYTTTMIFPWIDPFGKYKFFRDQDKNQSGDDSSND